jgi:hypothetical protein
MTTHTAAEIALAEAEREYDADANARGCYDAAIAALRERHLAAQRALAAVAEGLRALDALPALAPGDQEVAAAVEAIRTGLATAQATLRSVI